MMTDETAPLETDLVILATGFKGDEKLKDMFVSPAFKDCILGSPTASVPLYRLASYSMFTHKTHC